MSRVYWLLVLAMVSFAPAHADTPAPATATPPTVARVTEKLPVSAFAQFDFIEHARLSPDGSHVAGVFGISGRQYIIILPLYAGTEVPARVGLSDKLNVNWVRWVGNDDVMAGVQSQYDVKGQTWYLNRIISVNRNTKQVTKPMWNEAAQNADDVLWVPHDGTHKIIMALQTSIYTGHDFWPKVYKVDVQTGKSEVVLDSSEGVSGWYADANGDVRVGVERDDDHLRSYLRYRSGRNGTFHIVDRANDQKNESLIRPFVFLPGGDHGLVISTDKDQHSTIDEYDLAQNKFVKTITTAPGFDIEPIVAADGVTLLGTRTEAGGATWLDPALADLQGALAKSVPTATVDITSLSDDRTKMLVLVHGPDMPGILYYLRTEEGILHKIAAIKAEIGNRHLAEAKWVKYKARDGLEIEAKLTLPSGRDPKNLPIIMLPHGGPWAHDDMDFDYLSQFLANRGYVVLQPNFRGSDGYGPEFEQKSDGQLGLAMQDDISDGLKWVVKQGYADPARACIFGWSYGGYAAMWGIAKDPDQYRCGISMAGVSSVNKQMRIYDSVIDERAAKFQWSKLSTDFDAVSPINFVDKIKAPLLLLHGKVDTTVDVTQSRKMNAKMLAAGRTVQYVEMPLADHYALREADRATILTSLEAFLDKYNPADKAVAAAN
jgi:dipeptidyl aminopeptidase/acylaminoacyl peptidase